MPPKSKQEANTPKSATQKKTEQQAKKAAKSEKGQDTGPKSYKERVNTS